MRTIPILLIILLYSTITHALSPEEVLVLVNNRNPDSLRIAQYYMEKRGLPKENILELSIVNKEKCSRAEYDTQIAQPVKAFLQNNPVGKNIRCILLSYGFPLKNAPSEINAHTKATIEQLYQKQKVLKTLITQKEGTGDAGKDEIEEHQKNLRQISAQIQQLRREDELSSLDSEISLVLAPGYSLSAWVKNPYFLGFQSRKDSNSNPMISKNQVLMVSRLDGPTPETAIRIIDDSLEAEKKGLKGRACFDARWPESKEKARSGYSFYDQSIHRVARKVEKSGLLTVNLNQEKALFQPGDCPETVLYCGWYSLAKYVDAFEWLPGAIGYHIASSECITLKKEGSRVWCKLMLEKGAAATIGPVAEPYVNAFPVPELFFGYLVDGYLTLAECYMLSLPYLSWRMVLIGDPLYRPFRARYQGQRTEIQRPEPQTVRK